VSEYLLTNQLDLDSINFVASDSKWMSSKEASSCAKAQVLDTCCPIASSINRWVLDCGVGLIEIVGRKSFRDQ
jgi:hypothetical protein